MNIRHQVSSIIEVQTSLLSESRKAMINRITGTSLFNHFEWSLEAEGC
jgi:hypothetical protein